MTAPGAILRGLTSVVVPPATKGRRFGGDLRPTRPFGGDLMMDLVSRGSAAGYGIDRGRGSPPPSGGESTPQAPSIPGYSDIAWEGQCDYTWYYWGESAAKNGYAGVTSKAGWPDNYTYTADTVTFDKLRGRPWTRGALVTGVTKMQAARWKGSLSRGKNYHYAPGRTDQLLSSLFQAFELPWQEGETLTGEASNLNTNEVSLMCLLVAYGGFTHPYPRTIDEVVAYSGLGGMIKAIHTPQISVTSASAIAAGSGAAALDAADQEEDWLSADSVYVLLGFIPDLVENKGMLQVNKNLPRWFKDRNVGIPFGSGANAVSFQNDGLGLPYEAIGPFSGLGVPSLGLFSTAAAATTGSLIIGEI